MRHALRHRPDHIVVGEVRGAEAADLLQALNTGHGGSRATVHANNTAAALSRLAACAMQASDAPPWTVVCRGVGDGIEAVIHQTREGVRRVDQMVRVRDYDAQVNRWVIDPVSSAPVANTGTDTGAEAAKTALPNRVEAAVRAEAHAMSRRAVSGTTPQSRRPVASCPARWPAVAGSR